MAPNEVIFDVTAVLKVDQTETDQEGGEEEKEKAFFHNKKETGMRKARARRTRLEKRRLPEKRY